MAENKSNDPYPTGTYVKGDQTRSADTTADAVQAVFDGFTRVQTEADVDGGFASVNDNSPEVTRTEETLKDEDSTDASTEAQEPGQASEEAAQQFSAERPSETSATPDTAPAQPAEPVDPDAVSDADEANQQS